MIVPGAHRSQKNRRIEGNVGAFLVGFAIGISSSASTPEIWNVAARQIRYCTVLGNAFA